MALHDRNADSVENDICSGHQHEEKSYTSTTISTINKNPYNIHFEFAPREVGDGHERRHLQADHNNQQPLSCGLYRCSSAEPVGAQMHLQLCGLGRRIVMLRLEGELLCYVLFRLSMAVLGGFRL